MKIKSEISREEIKKITPQLKKTIVKQAIGLVGIFVEGDEGGNN